MDTEPWTHFSKSPEALGWETPAEPEGGPTPIPSLSLEINPYARFRTMSLGCPRSNLLPFTQCHRENWRPRERKGALHVTNVGAFCQKVCGLGKGGEGRAEGGEA